MPAERAHLQVARQLHPWQVAVVLARAREAVGLLLGPADQRRANPAALQQHRDRGAERARANDGGTARMLAGIADGRGR
jgi:hypothetical protein